MPQPLVSIVMCTFNGEAFLQEQLNTIVNQTYPNFEVIICDDNSTDNTRNILHKNKAQCNKIFVYENEIQLGYNKNFEKGCSIANGEFIAICDQDDIWELEKISEMMKLFTANDVMLVHSQSIRFENELPKQLNQKRKLNLLEGNNVRQQLYLNTVSGHNIMYRKSLLTIASPFPQNVFYDWWLCICAATQGNIKATKKVLTYHRLHQNNVTIGKVKNYLQTKNEAIENITNLENFIQVIPLKDKAFTEFFLTLLNELKDKRFSFRLFVFLFQNAKTFFYFKTKIIPFFSYLKMSYRLSWAK